MKQHNEVKPMENCYIITVRPQVYLDYEILAKSEEEAWKKYHAGEWEGDPDEDFTGFDWKPATIQLSPVQPTDENE